MLIDWFTVGAQALNFAVLVWLMQRYLYRPVLGAIDAREKRIAAELADADARKKEAAAERDEFVQKNGVFDQQRTALLDKATAEAATERERLLDAAAHAADEAAAQRRHALQNEAAALNRALGLCARQEVYAIARQTLADLASDSLEERICEIFVDRLRALDGAARQSLVAALAAATEPALLRSAFALAETQHAAIQQVLHETCATTKALRFATAPELVAGIELRVGGQRLDWSIAHHVDELERRVGELVTNAARPEVVSEPVAPAAAKHPADVSVVVAASPMAIAA